MDKRLQSLKLPRDLTLGGTKAKKAYVPNLNVVRNKDKTKEFFRKNEQKRKEKNDKKFNNNKQFDRSQRYVQSTGVFSEGANTDMARKAFRGERYNIREELTPISIAVPTIKKDSWQVNKSSEDNVYDELMNCNDVSDDDEKVHFKPTTWDEKDLKESHVPNNTGVKVEVKTEGDETAIHPEFKKLKLDTSTYNTLPDEYLDEETVGDPNPVLTLWGLPDSFAGKGLSDDPNITTIFDYKLNDMLEGKIGKIVIRQSGKTEVYIGNIKYDLDPTDLECFTEEIVAINLKEKGDSAVAVLGEIQNRFILNPDWDYLLK